MSELPPKGSRLSLRLLMLERKVHNSGMLPALALITTTTVVLWKHLVGFYQPTPCGGAHHHTSGTRVTFQASTSPSLMLRSNGGNEVLHCLPHASLLFVMIYFHTTQPARLLLQAQVLVYTQKTPEPHQPSQLDPA